MAGAAELSLDSPLTALHGVGSERAMLLARLKLHTIGDLLLHAPRRYEDRRKFARIADLKLGEAATVQGRIVAAGVKRCSSACLMTARLGCTAAGGRCRAGWRITTRWGASF
jgi:ATP-dependent DNA helicase RecG